VEARRIDVKLGKSGVVQFISGPYEINNMSKTLAAARIAHEVSLLADDLSMLRLLPSVYDSLCPGVKKPIATFRDGKSNLPTKQIIFTDLQKAYEYVNVMATMRCNIIQQIPDGNIVNGVEYNHGVYIIRTDQTGLARLNASYHYFQELDNYATLKFLEDSFANLLATFDQDLLSYYAEVKSESLNSMRGIISNDFYSNRTKIIEILDVYAERTGKNDDSIWGGIKQIVREAVRDSQSSNFLITFSNFHLKEKMDDIIKQAQQTENYTSSNVHINQTVEQYDAFQTNPFLQQPVVPHPISQHTMFVQQPMMQQPVINQPVQFIQQTMVPQVISQPTPQMSVQTNPFLNRPQSPQGFANAPFGFYAPSQQPGFYPQGQLQPPYQEIQQPGIYNPLNSGGGYYNSR